MDKQKCANSDFIFKKAEEDYIFGILRQTYFCRINIADMIFTFKHNILNVL